MPMLATLEGTRTPRRQMAGCLGAFDYAQPDEDLTIKRAIAIYKERGQRQDPDFELGVFNFPVLNFIMQFLELKRNSPQLNDEEAAAVTYFGMIARQPAPTANFQDIAIDWAKVDGILYNKDNGLDPNKVMPWWEMCIATNYGGGLSKIGGKWAVWFPIAGIGANDVLKKIGSKNVRTTRDLQTSYIESIYHLNRFLYYNGLYGGVEKTLAEESRRLQGLRAQALASQQAAAKALALSKASENVSADVVTKYENQLKRAQLDEKELTDYLNRINGAPKGTGDVDTDGMNTGTVLAFLGIAAVAATAFMG